MARLLTLKDVKPASRESMDTVKRQYLSPSRNMNILLQAQLYYQNLEQFRKDGDRCNKFYLGDGWSDVVEVDGKLMREDTYIRLQGKTPLQQNLIRRLGRNVVGIYRDESKEPICVARDKEEQMLGDTMSELLGYVWRLNKADSLFARSLEYFLVRGAVAMRHWYGWGLNRNECDCWLERMDMNRMFWDTFAEKDDLSDARMIGYLHDMELNKACEMFAHSPKEYRQLTELFRQCADPNLLQSQFETFGRRRLENIDFLTASDPAKCRIIEIWTLEHKPRYHCHDWQKGECFKIDVADYNDEVLRVNERRIKGYAEMGIPQEEVPLVEAEWFIDNYWYYRFMTPNGVVIQEGETPYDHKKPPFVVRLYPMLNGEIRSFVADLIDVQKMVNRLITKYDWIMSASAQGLVMVPEESISDKMPIESIAENWAKFNGVIVYKSRNGSPAPHQVSSNSTNIGILELLNLQLKFIEDISSVNGALQGKQGYSGMSGTLYAQQTQNSTKGLLDLLETYSDFVCENALMDVKNIQQFYDINKVVNIVGQDSADITSTAQKALNVDYDLSIVESTSSPAYKERGNEWLMQLLQNGLITLEQMLDVGKFPFSEQLKQAISAQKEKLEKGQVPSGMDPSLVNQVQQGADMDAVNQLYNAMKQNNVGQPETPIVQ